jgi:hypothetical protein
VLVRGIPKKTKESCSSDVDDFFTKYHASSYLFHQVVYKVGKVQKIMVSNSHTIFLFVGRMGVTRNATYLLRYYFCDLMFLVWGFFFAAQ